MVLTLCIRSQIFIRGNYKSKTIRRSVLIMLALIFSVMVVVARDLDRTNDHNIRAKADLSGFRAQLSIRFILDGCIFICCTNYLSDF